MDSDNPLDFDNLVGTDLMGVDPVGVDPVGVDPVGVDPVGGHQLMGVDLVGGHQLMYGSLTLLRATSRHSSSWRYIPFLEYFASFSSFWSSPLSWD